MTQDGARAFDHFATGYSNPLNAFQKRLGGRRYAELKAHDAKRAVGTERGNPRHIKRGSASC
ncbi:MAG: hypothetical protein CM15mP89_5300 [Gammaproteobacteria bacterium]|nr:MAG: hypothetical protein CM15mP89_5300 [Gammaproteobacteria bacterium]